MRRAFASLLALALLLCVPAAQAAYEPLGSGQTKLSLDKSFLATLKQNGVKLAAVAPAKLKAGTVSFPVSAGKLDPTTASGTVEHEGVLVFKAAGGSVPVKALQLKTTQKRSPFSAKVGGSQLKIASAKSLAVARAGFASKVRVSRLALSAKLATRLAKKLGLRGIVEAGMPFGSAVTTANPKTIRLLARNKAALNLDPAFTAKLASLFVAVNPIFPAERPGPFTLQVSGGEIAPDASEGRIATAGALEFLQQGGGQAFWAESSLQLEAKSLVPEVELRPAPPYAGKLGPQPVAAFALSSSSASPKARTVSLAGALALDAATARTFNELFAAPLGRGEVFAAGEAVGTVGLSGVGQSGGVTVVR